MANIMLRRTDRGDLVFYLPKKDLEETVRSIEWERADHWGGTLELAGGGRYFIDPMPEPKRFPVTLRARRMDT